MKTAIDNPSIPLFYPVATVIQDIPAGGAGWVDTDMSATLGLDTARSWFIACFVAGAVAQNVGARHNGSAETPLCAASMTQAVISRVSAAGHIDFYRNAAVQTSYQVIGYFK